MINCVVKDCKATPKRNRGITLHEFPDSIGMIKLWLLMTGNDLGDLDTFAQQVLDSREQLQYRICSKHFSPRCYIWTGKDLVLKPDAVPTIFGKKSNGLDMKDNANFSPSNKGQVAGSLQQHGGKETNALELHESMEIPDINEGVVDAETSKPKPGMKNASTSTCRMMVDNSTNTEPSAGKADKGVQWPEYEFNFNGERWKILHDHYYPYHLNAATPTKKSALDGSNLIKSESFSQPIPKQQHTTLSSQNSAGNPLYSQRDSLTIMRSKEVSIKKERLENDMECIIVKKDSAHKDGHQGNGEVIIKSGDIAIYFTMEEWDYIVHHKGLYTDMMDKAPQTTSSLEATINTSPDIKVEVMDPDLDYQTPLDLVMDPSTDDIKVEVMDPDLDYQTSLDLVMDPSTDDIKVEVMDPDLDYQTSLDLVMDPSTDIKAEVMDPDLDYQTPLDLVMDPSTGEPMHGEISEDWQKNKYYTSPSVASLCLNQASTEKNLVCSGSGMSKESLENRRLFYSVHQPANGGDEPLQCNECEEGFIDENHLMFHKRIRHGKECNECEKYTGRRFLSTNHRKTRGEEKLHKCKFCWTRFCTYHFIGHLRMHFRKNPKWSVSVQQPPKTQSENLYKCMRCEKQFDIESKFMEHLEIHKSEKLPVCTECGRCFTQKNGLLRHQKTHTK